MSTPAPIRRIADKQPVPNWILAALDEAGCEPDLIVTKSPRWGSRLEAIIRKHMPDQPSAPTEVPQEAAGEDDEDCSDETLTPRDLERMAEGKKRFLAASAPTTDEAIARWKDCAEYGWTIIANASGGNWERESKDWQEAAAKFRDAYYACLDADRARISTPSPSQDTEDSKRLDKLITSMVPTFLENDAGIVCLDESEFPEGQPDEPMTNFKHWPTAREAIDHMGERTEAGKDFLNQYRAARNSPSSHRREKGL